VLYPRMQMREVLLPRAEHNAATKHACRQRKSPWCDSHRLVDMTSRRLLVWSAQLLNGSSTLGLVAPTKHRTLLNTKGTLLDTASAHA